MQRLEMKHEQSIKDQCKENNDNSDSDLSSSDMNSNSEEYIVNKNEVS